MKKILIYGASGFAKEVAHLIEDINNNMSEWEIIGFVDDFITDRNININGYPLTTVEQALKDNETLAIAIGVGSPKAKQIILDKLSTYENIYFPNLIHPKTRISSTNQIGKGIIICEGSILTTNIILKDFVTLNLNCTIGHDTEIKEFTTILPNASISGNIIINKGVDIGTNATIIEKLEIGENSIIGAGSVVVRDIPDNCTAVGIPAKPIKFHNRAIEG
ncbi:acetyltransferase [Mesobacillus subterraneus]|uniref:acetyltransferase n=1 Tax=Mesobacillus subterraneus TaxID=285983 RepID=UPI001CFE1DF6|nr:acetyltransferase [Mesobacillus subterraneus]WLR55470.1 acetyltransferase [Mesobacillus subterraneus]